MTSNSTGRPLPGRAPLPREFVLRHQRARIIAALAEEASDKGYANVTVADVVKRAKIARNTFYGNFASKEACFLAAQEHGIAVAVERVVAAAAEREAWPQRVEAGMTAFVRYVIEEPALARTCMVEALTAGPEAVRRYEESLQTFVSLLESGRNVSPHAADMPETMEEAIVGGLFWIVHQRLVLGEVDSVTGVLPELVEFALTPYVGAETARQVAAGAELGSAGYAH
ncbi:MAG: TetR/AcrR family transcriptional regulator [Actinomycetota bacterium]|nr:TetR/AcrR family transcriptional regulator [Actinomycetota bacterium]